MMMNNSHTSKLFLIFFVCTTTFMICLSSCSTTPPITQYSVMGPNLNRVPSPDEALQLFLQWVRENGRNYKNLDELGRKFEIFLDNLKFIAESNDARTRSGGSSYLLGLNEFADWSYDEFKRVYLPEPDIDQLPIDEQRRSAAMENVSAPASLDWRTKGVVTPVKNQGSCGSCWAYGSTGAIEGINAIETGRLVSLSEQELLDCAYNLGCEGGGWVTRGYDWVISNGIASEAAYPYRAVQGTCRASQVPRSTSTIRSYVAYLQRTDSALLTATVKQPIAVSLYVLRDFQLYVRGIYDGPNCPRDSLSTNHVMLIVGYDSLGPGQDYWIVKNSWGTRWGLTGYMWIKRNTGLQYGVCAINSRATYPVRQSSASSDQSVSSM